MKPRAATLFCGAGGADHGLVAAVFDVVAGLDVNEAALKTYQAAGGRGVSDHVYERAGARVLRLAKPVPGRTVAELARRQRRAESGR